MLETEVSVTNALGLHARAAARLVKLASSFSSTVSLRRDDSGVEADAKSILSLLYIAAAQGVKLKLTADGDDEREALEQIAAMFAAGFGEER